MSPAARRQLAENVTAVFGRSASRLATEAAPAPVAQSAAARSRMAPAEARVALQREANELRRTGVAGSDPSALVMACEARPDIAADAGYTTDVVAGIVGQHLTPTPRTGQLGRRPA